MFSAKNTPKALMPSQFRGETNTTRIIAFKNPLCNPVCNDNEIKWKKTAKYANMVKNINDTKPIIVINPVDDNKNSFKLFTLTANVPDTVVKPLELTNKNVFDPLTTLNVASLPLTLAVTLPVAIWVVLKLAIDATYDAVRTKDELKTVIDDVWEFLT